MIIFHGGLAPILQFGLALSAKFGELLAVFGEKKQRADPGEKTAQGTGKLLRYLVTLLTLVLRIIHSLFDLASTWRNTLRTWEYKFVAQPNDTLLFGNIKALTQSMTIIINILKGCNACLSLGGALSADIYQLRAEALCSLGSMIYSNQLAQNKLDSAGIGGLAVLGATICWPHEVISSLQAKNPK